MLNTFEGGKFDDKYSLRLFFCELPRQIQPYLFICITYCRRCHKSYRILKHVSHAVTSHSRYLSSDVYCMTFGSSADKPGDLRAPLMQLQQWCYVHTGLYYTAGWLHRIPFAIWHRHVVLACDRCCTALVPEVTNDLLDCLFFFSHKELFVWRWPPMQPQAPWWTWRLLLLVFWDHIYLKWIVSVCTWEGLSEWMCASVCLRVKGRACGCTRSGRCLTNHP